MWGRISLLAVVAGCYAPPEPDCGFACGPNGECPSDYTCQGDGVCHRNGTSLSLVCPSPIPFDVTSAAATSATAITVTFSAIPDPTSAAALSSYTVANLQLTGTPTVTGTTVTIQTAPQTSTSYTIMVGGVVRATDAKALRMTSATFNGIPPFDVMSAVPVTSHSIAVTYDAPPDPTSATTLASYVVAGLALSGTPTLSGSTVTLTSAAQAAQSYTVSVSNVVRASDAQPLVTASATFTGRVPFDVASAAFASGSTTSMTVTFDAAPDPTTSQNAANYTVAGLTLSNATLAGSVVTLATTTQSAPTYTVTIANVIRASDSEPLTTKMASFNTQCGDGMKDGNETDVDCGGAACTARCAMGKMCLVGTDCTSGTCQAGNTCM